MIPSTPSIGISIATKNRWEDVEYTLDHLKAQGLDSLETILLDDGSPTPAPSHFAAKFPWVKFVRYETSQGQSRQRNRIAEMLSTPFVLQLDDDSSPIAGDLGKAVAWMNDHPQVCSLAFRISFRDEKISPDLAPSAPFPAKFFVGCATLLKKDLFHALGGYEGRFGYAAEESDFCFRAIQQGYEIYAYHDVVIEHRVSKAERPAGKRTQEIIRNSMLMCLWYYPFPMSYMRALPFVFNRLLKDAYLRAHWPKMFIGAFQGLICYFTWPHQKKRLSWEQYRKWQAARYP